MSRIPAFSLVLMLSAHASNVLAETQVSVGNSRPKATIALLDEEDSEALFASLAIEEHVTRSGVVKYLETADQALKIYCTKGTTPISNATRCTVTIEIQRKK